jgi:hypothetical protein
MSLYFILRSQLEFSNDAISPIEPWFFKRFIAGALAVQKKVTSQLSQATLLTFQI